MTEVEKQITGWTSTDQSGLPGHCHMAQVFGSDGNALAFVEPTNPPTLASERARLIAASPDMMEALLVAKEELYHIAHSGCDPDSEDSMDSVACAYRACRDALAKATQAKP